MRQTEAANAFVEYVNNKYGEDIALVAQYGSTVHGTMTERSDVDLFFIPATPRGRQASIQFVLGGIGYDFYPISWERAESLAAFQSPWTTLIADSRLLYVRSEEDRNRFQELRQSVAFMLEPESRLPMLRLAAEQLERCHGHLYRMSHADGSAYLTYTRMEAYEVLTRVLHSLAMLNGTYFRRGWGNHVDELEQLPVKPERTTALLRTIMTDRRSTAIRQACELLVDETARLIRMKEEELRTGPLLYSDHLTGFYEEAVGWFNKLRTACETNNYANAFFTAVTLQQEVGKALYQAETGLAAHHDSEEQTVYAYYDRYGFPDLVALLDSDDLDPLLTAVNLFDDRLRQLFLSREVRLLEFACINQLEDYLAAR